MINQVEQVVTGYGERGDADLPEDLRALGGSALQNALEQSLEASGIRITVNERHPLTIEYSSSSGIVSVQKIIISRVEGLAPIENTANGFQRVLISGALGHWVMDGAAYNNLKLNRDRYGKDWKPQRRPLTSEDVAALKTPLLEIKEVENKESVAVYLDLVSAQLGATPMSDKT